MVVGIIDHTTGTRDIRKLARLGDRAPAARGRSPRWPRRAWPGCRRSSGSSARKPHFDAVLDARPSSAAPARIVLGRRRGVRFDPHRRLQRAVHVGRLRPQAARRSPSPASRACTGRPDCSSARPACSRSRAWLAGLAAPQLEKLLTPYARHAAAGGSDYHLALWHGLNLPLVLTVARHRRRHRAVLGAATGQPAAVRHPPLGNADRIYDATLRGMDALSVRLTARHPARFAARRPRRPSSARWSCCRWSCWRSAREPARTSGCGIRRCSSLIGLMMIAAALGATVMRNRLASVLLVGLTGYGCGVIFALHGAPDLALTQFLVETLTLVIFVLVLRKLPAEVDERRHQRFQLPRALLARRGRRHRHHARRVFAMARPHSAPISELLPDAAYYLGNGKNAVNVLLVDIRAWDTLGEISVLLVAATGVASLVFRNRRFGTAPRVVRRRPPASVTSRRRPRRRRRHVAARQRADRPAAPVAGPRGHDPADLPDHHGAVGLLLLRRPQRARRRFRRRPDRRSRAGAALPRRRPLRTRRDAAARRGQDPRRRAGLSAGTAVASLLLGAPALSSAVFEVDAAAARPRQVGHRAVLRPRACTSSWSAWCSTCCAASARAST